MRIIKAELMVVRLTLKVPFETSYGVVTEKETVLVKALSSDGLTGYGEAPAFASAIHTYESGGEVFESLARLLLPLVINRDLPSPSAAAELMATSWPGYRMARSAVEAAFWHIAAQEASVPLYALWNGDRDRIPAALSLGMAANTSDLLEDVGRGIGAGYRRIKVKIAPGKDSAILTAIRDAYPSAPLSADANRGYRLHQVERLLSLDTYGLTMIEEPLEGDASELADLQSKLATPICLDESITSAHGVDHSLSVGSCRIVSVKPAQVGGYIEAQRAGWNAARRGRGAWCGGMLESGIGKAFLLHLASLACFSLPSEISATDRYFKEDVLMDPIRLDPDGYIRIPEGVGLGYRVDEEAIHRLSVRRLNVTG